MTDEQKAAVERLRAGRYDDHKRQDMFNFSRIRMNDCVELAHLYLDEHPADDADPADYDWLNALRSENDQPLSMLAVRLCDDGFHLMAPGRPSEGIDGLNDYVAPHPATKGDVRRLCAALGVPLEEGQNRTADAERREALEEAIAEWWAAEAPLTDVSVQHVIDTLLPRLCAAMGVPLKEGK